MKIPSAIKYIYIRISHTKLVLNSYETLSMAFICTNHRNNVLCPTFPIHTQMVLHQIER